MAVLAVLLFHVLGWPQGGFLGVDVFFVVSGYVITATLLRRAGATGRVDLGAFYLRRARRILPLALLVRAVVVLAATLGLASLGWAWWQSATDATLAFYSTLTRVWQLALGCLLATLPALRLPDAARSALSWLGLAGVVAAIGLTGQGVGVPVPAGLAACLATGLVLLAGRGHEPRGSFLLVNPLSRFVGDLSYGLYLWHFPVALVGAAWLGLDHPGFAPLALGLSFALAAITYHLVERPFLSGARWRPMAAASTAHAVRVASFAAASALAPNWWDAAPAPVIPSATPLPGPTATAAPTPISPPPSPTTSPTPTASVAPEVALGLTGEQVQDGLRGGLARERWPGDLAPSRPDDGGNPWPGVNACEATDPSDPNACTFGNPDGPEIVVFGDSLGINLLATVEAAYGQTHRIRGLTKLACAVNGVDADFGKQGWELPCQRHTAAVLAYVAEAKPKILIMVQNYHWANRLTSGAEGEAGAAEWIAADQAITDAVTAAGTQMVIVTPSVPGVGYYDCYRAGGSPQRCTTGVAAWWQRVHDAEKRVQGAPERRTVGPCPGVAPGRLSRARGVARRARPGGPPGRAARRRRTRRAGNGSTGRSASRGPAACSRGRRTRPAPR